MPSSALKAADPALRRDLRAELSRARAWTDRLFALVEPEALQERPVAERHRLIFYLGHLEAFDFNLVCRDVLGERSSRPAFEALFAFGIDPVDGNLPSDSPGDWPGAHEVEVWNRELRGAVDTAVARAPLSGWLEGGWALHLAVEHRLMHAETLCYLLQRLPLDRKRPGPLPDLAPGRLLEGSAAMPARKVTLGLRKGRTPHLGWDNEYERHEVDVPAFRLQRRPVSNGDWLAFVNAGCYRERSLWTDAAWAWLSSAGITHPGAWRRSGTGWTQQAMFAEVPLPLDWPVYVSHAEATAYARWRGGSLPTEAQWHGAAASLRPAEWRAGEHGNFGGLRFEPIASGRAPASDSAEGVADLAGNGWEWTSTVFTPFEGFAPLPFYRGYSANFFDGQHYVLKGASAATDATLLRPSFRNWFQPHYQHAWAKFRLADEGGAT